MMRGNLILTSDDEVIDVGDQELGLLHQVKPSDRPIYLYAGLPTHKLEQITKKRDDFDLFPVTHATKFPAVLVTKNDEAIGVQTELQAGQYVIARRVPGVGKGVYEVVTFKAKGKKIDDMPESGAAISILNKGYVLSKHLDLAPNQTETFKRVPGDIFPRDDLIGDVKQSIFGDCFLLSSVLSILRRPGGRDFIKGMMRQDGNHTIVRLYDPGTNEPVYYRIQNTQHCRDGNTTVKHGAPWVHILEKAYTAHAQKKNMSSQSADEFYYANPSFRDMFGDGGKPAVAFRILTGEGAREVSIHRAKSYPWDQEGLIYSMSVYNRVEPLMELGDAVLTDLDNLLVKYAASKDGLRILNQFATVASDVSGNDLIAIYRKLQANDLAAFIFEKIDRFRDEDEHLNLLHAASHYVSEHIKLCINSPLALSDVLDEIRLVAKMGSFVKHELMAKGEWGSFEDAVNVDSADLTLENMTSSYNRLSNYDLPEDVYASFAEYMGQKVENFGWDGALGTGLYSPKTLEVFEDIQKNFEAGQPVAASTRNTFPAEVPGLRPQHAYAVTGVSEEGDMKFIHVRNPWGRMGRKYHFDDRKQREISGQPLATEEEGADFAESKIELSDFARYFGDYTVGNVPPQLEMQYVAPPKRTFLQRHAAKFAGASIGMVIGAAIGAAIGFALLPFTFGVSVPLFAAIGAVIGGAVLGGLPGLFVGRAIDKKRDQRATYIPVSSSEDTDTESVVSSPELGRRRSLSAEDMRDLEFNSERSDELRVSGSGMYRLKKDKEEMEPDTNSRPPSPRRKK